MNKLHWVINSVKVSWKKVSGAKAYTQKNLKKGKTWYVRIRARKKFGGKTYYGVWSKVRKVKIK